VLCVTDLIKEKFIQEKELQYAMTVLKLKRIIHISNTQNVLRTACPRVSVNTIQETILNSKLIQKIIKYRSETD